MPHETRFTGLYDLITDGPPPKPDLLDAADTPACNEPCSHCRCVLVLGHEGVAHLCDCGGSWSGTPRTDSFTVIALPPGPAMALPEGLRYVRENTLPAVAFTSITEEEATNGLR